MSDFSPNIAAVSRNAMVKRIQAADGSLVLVSEYSRRPLAVEIECPVIRPSRVIELASGKTIAAITPENPRFRMELKDERAVMLYVGP